MEQNIEQILRDLYAIDPKLQEHEQQLYTLVKNLLAAKPDTKFDAAFAEKLKRQLAARASLMGSRKPYSNFMSAFGGKKFAYLITGVSLAALILVTINYQNLKTPSTDQGIHLLSSNVQISQQGAEAFGNLADSSVGNLRGMGGGGGPQTSSNQASPKMIAPDAGGGIMPASIKYVYAGDALKQDKDQLEVFKRDKSLNVGDTSSLIKQLNLGLIDLNKFSNAQVQQITLNENKEFGYSVTVDLHEGTLFIYAAWEKWPMPEQQCQDEACYKALQLKPSDIPADEEVVNIANAFLKDYSISTKNYGQPEVANMWRQEYAAATDKSQVYVPDTLSVIYPLRVNGQEIFDQSGNKTGLTVSVNVRVKKVSGVNELTSLNYQSSMYGAETDTAKILDYLNRNPYYAMPYLPDMKTTEVKLGTPTVSYVKMYQYKDATSSDLLVPAYIFPIIDLPQDQYIYSRNVVVPLVKEMLEDQNGGPIRILPMAK